MEATKMKVGVMKFKRYMMGDFLGSLTYMGRCFVCGSQFMSTREYVFVPEGSCTRYCTQCTEKKS